MSTTDSVGSSLMNLADRYQRAAALSGETSKTSGGSSASGITDEERELLENQDKDKSTLSFTDMLGLMIAQFQNQTIDNQASTTDMMNQLVQMSTMQAMTDMTSQMKELTLTNVMAYSASLVDKVVTVGVYDKDGKLQEVVGTVKGTGMYNGQPVIYLEDDKGYFLSDIMAVGTLPKPETPTDPDDSTGDSTGDSADNSGGSEDGKTKV